MQTASSYGRIKLGSWVPCSATPPADAVQQCRQLQDAVRETCDQDRGVIRLYVGPDVPVAEPSSRLAAS